MEFDLTKLKLDAPTATMLEQVRTNVDDLTLVLGPVWQCCELEERDGTIEPDKLERLGLNVDAAAAFALVYNYTKSYLQHHRESHFIKKEHETPRALARGRHLGARARLRTHAFRLSSRRA